MVPMSGHKVMEIRMSYPRGHEAKQPSIKVLRYRSLNIQQERPMIKLVVRKMKNISLLEHQSPLILSSLCSKVPLF